jgi:surface protein
MWCDEYESNRDRALEYYGHISNWDVSHVTNMHRLFGYVDSYLSSSYNFNGDISQWDVSNVTNMELMFFKSEFKGDISKWNVSNVTSMRCMFYKSQFEGGISKWDVSNVTNMTSMFEKASSFNSDISEWDVSNVTEMDSMFLEASSFNTDISEWDVSNVTEMDNMFLEASSFNGDLSKWNVSNVTSRSWFGGGPNSISPVFMPPACETCGCAMAVSAYLPRFYLTFKKVDSYFGWFCDGYMCSHYELGRKGGRWFCRSCQNDLCLECGGKPIDTDADVYKKDILIDVVFTEATLGLEFQLPLVKGCKKDDFHKSIGDVQVDRVVNDSNAMKLGIKIGDILKVVDNTFPVKCYDDFTKYIQEIRKEDKMKPIPIQFLRPQLKEAYN